MYRGRFLLSWLFGRSVVRSFPNGLRRHPPLQSGCIGTAVPWADGWLLGRWLWLYLLELFLRRTSLQSHGCFRPGVTAISRSLRVCLYPGVPPHIWYVFPQSSFHLV